MTASRIDELAKDFNVLRGKWMCFPHTDQVDSVWETLAHALASNDLAPVSEIKVAPRYTCYNILFPPSLHHPSLPALSRVSISWFKLNTTFVGSTSSRM